MTLAGIPLRRAKPDTISTLHKRELTSGPQGHTWTEHRIALGTFPPMPRGLLCPKSHIFTWDSLGGGARQDSVSRAGPGLPKVPPSQSALVRDLGRGAGQQEENSGDGRWGDQPLFRDPPVAHTLS